MKSDTRENGISDDERRLLIFRAAELSARSENCAVASSFLTPAEQRIVFDSIRASGAAEKLCFWGGYFGAERRKAVFLPDWLCPEKNIQEGLFSPEREKFYCDFLQVAENGELLDETICPVLLKGSGYEKLSHRDFLGALMGLGLRRSVLGDIVSDGENTYLFCEKSRSEYIVSELKKVGRDTVKASVCLPDKGFSPKREFEEISVTVASPRADGVVRALCKISREAAAEEIRSGNVLLNYFQLDETEKQISNGDIISVRGYGKFIIDKADDVTKKGRIRVEARQYIS